MSTLSVTAIQMGTVIDHIRPHAALKLLQLLKLDQQGAQITVGLNLKSASMGRKDLIKIEGTHLQEKALEPLAIFAPKASINWIENFTITQKFFAKLPKTLSKILTCPSSNCISHQEGIDSCFHIQATPMATLLICHFCERIYTQQRMLADDLT